MAGGRRPAYIGLANAIGRGMGRVGLSCPGLNAGQLLRSARRRTGLDDFGDDSFREGLDRLIWSLDAEAELSQVGRIAARFNLLDYLCVRLELVNQRALRPEIVQRELAPPLVILGLPRTGTTILYELFAQDPAFRSPASWEVARPLPPPTAASYASDSRIARSDRMFSWLEKLSPGFRAIHPIGARLPQECVYLLASHFASEQFAYMYNVPTYRDWLRDCDMTAAYQWHAGFLQHLQVDLSADRWVLKAPAHLGHLKYLLARYPEAAVVWTHRSPLDAVASFSSLVTNLRAAFSDSVNPLAAGQQELAHSAAVLARGMADREQFSPERFFDASFAAICDNPLAVVEAIYVRFGWPLSAEARTRMQAYLEQHPRFQYGKHNYSATDYGLDTASEEAIFGPYLRYYGAVLQ